MGRVSFRKLNVDGLNIFYREAGAEDAPAVLLLHGFPSASHMFRDLIPRLSDRFRVVAPDFPGFGQSDMPSREGFFVACLSSIAFHPQQIGQVIMCGGESRLPSNGFTVGVFGAS